MEETHAENGTSLPVAESQVKTESSLSAPPVSQPVPEQKPVHHNTPPVHEMVGGSLVRQYLNKNLTPHLLEGLRAVGKNQPEDPLLELGQFLIARSRELKEKSV